MDALRVAKVERVVLERTTDTPPHTRVQVEGTLHLTPHHLIFRPSAATPASPTASSSSAPPIPEAETSASEVWVPYPTINVLQRLPQSAGGKYPLRVGTKTFDTYTLMFEKDREGGAEDVWQSVRDCAVAQNVEQLYAFFYTLPRSPVAPKAELKPPVGSSSPASGANPLEASPLEAAEESPDLLPSAPEPPATGWTSYNQRAEFARQGVGARTKAWRFTDINRDYALCPTYPSKLVVPSRISDTLLTYAAKYRSKGRIPALSYLHWANHASITRSSQPMIGIKNTRSPQDERLVECIFQSHLSPDTAFSSTTPPTLSTSSSSTSIPTASTVYGATPTNLIIDARPTANAMANKAKGAGTENMDWYRFAKKQHLGIDNIHVMRNSLKGICEALEEAEATQLPVDSYKLRRTNWLKHIGGILEGSLTIVRNVHIYSSHVLIHCSDGWDRTSQLSAIAQLCLDPYFRTLEGFKVLIEKDWLSFGHMFLQRSGHLASDKMFTATPDDLDADEQSDDDFGTAVKGVQAFFGSVTKQFQSASHLKEISPVFHQFLDSVRQIQRQFPDRFEFNEDYLLDLHYHLYACQFGTFMFDSERQRRVPQGKNEQAYVERTVSAWEWFDQPAQRERYLNADFNPELDDRASRLPESDLGVLLPDPKDVTFWHRLFKRSDEEMNPPAARFLASEIAVPEAEKVEASSVSTSSSDISRPPVVRSDSSVAAPSPIATSSSSPFTRVAPKQQGSSWNWSQLSNGLSTGALSAFNQIKASATEAVSQLRESADDEMGWSTSTGRSEGDAYAPGTGIGEARAAGGLPRTSLRIPSEANPWMVDPPSSIVAAEGTSNGAAIPAPSRSQPASATTPRSADTWDIHSPDRSGWKASGPLEAPRSLADLSLDDVAGKKKAAQKKDAEDKAMLDAALGGDSKAWDPLGAL